MRRIRPLAVVTVLGIALVGISAGVVLGLNAKQKTYTVHQLAAHWKAPYDLLVLPKGSPSVIGKLEDPNAIDEGQGGITLAEWKTIQAIKGVAVAAPLVPIGIVQFGLSFDFLDLPGTPGFFREAFTFRNIGLPNAISPARQVEPDGPIPSGGSYGIAFNSTADGLLIAVDPTAEAKLVGLDRAVTSGFYLQGGSTSVYVKAGGIDGYQHPNLFFVPVLLAKQSPIYGTQTFTASHLSLPWAPSQALQYMLGQKTPPPGTNSKVEFTGSIRDAQAWHAFEALAMNPKRKNIHVGSFLAPQNGQHKGGYPEIPGPVAYRRVKSPFPSRWPIALSAVPASCGRSCRLFEGTLGEPFRTLGVGKLFDIHLTAVGIYDPLKLNVADDPLTHLPLVNYRPEHGLLVLDSAGKALNPPQTVLPGNSPRGLFDPMPAAITSIQNVLPILSNAPISSIRVKVSGVNEFGLGAQAKLQALAQSIHRATGLKVEVVRGAAPQQVLVHPGAMKGYTKVGWIQEEWVRLGAGVEILRQTLLSQDVILVPVLFGAFIFALTAGVIGVEVRRREYATLLSVGVMPRTVRRSVLWEGALYGVVVLTLSLGAAYAVGGKTALSLTVPVGVLAGLVMFLALLPVARGIGGLEPLAALKDAAPSLARVVAPVSVLGMGVSLFFSSLRRHIASLAALMVPGAVFYLIFMVQSSLHRTMYLTTLGHYLLVRVGPLMELGAAVAVALAILASAQIGLRNATLRARTWAIGHAMGWPRLAPILASLVESAIIGLVAGILGATGGAIVGVVVFGTGFLWNTWALALLTILASGLLAALPATFVIAHQEPVAHLRGDAQ